MIPALVAAVGVGIGSVAQVISPDDHVQTVAAIVGVGVVLLGAMMRLSGKAGAVEQKLSDLVGRMSRIENLIDESTQREYTRDAGKPRKVQRGW